MASKNTLNKRRLFQSFLRERGLQTIFRRFNKLSQRKRKSVTLQVGGENRPAVAFKTKNRIIFRDPQSLAIISSTSKFKRLKDVPQFFRFLERDKSEFLGIKTTNNVGKFKPQFRRTDVSREIFKNTVHVETLRPLRKKVGKIFLSITFFKGSSLDRATSKVTFEGGSRKLRLLTDRSQRQEAFDEAFQGALSFLNFSYDGFVVNRIRFFYKLPKQQTSLVFA